MDDSNLDDRMKLHTSFGAQGRLVMKYEKLNILRKPIGSIVTELFVLFEGVHSGRASGVGIDISAWPDNNQTNGDVAC